MCGKRTTAELRLCGTGYSLRGVGGRVVVSYLRPAVTFLQLIAVVSHSAPPRESVSVRLPNLLGYSRGLAVVGG